MSGWLSYGIMGVGVLVFAAVIVTAWLNQRAVQQLHVAINSRLTEILLLTKEEAQASGELKGRADERSESAARASRVRKKQ